MLTLTFFFFFFGNEHTCPAPRSRCCLVPHAPRLESGERTCDDGNFPSQKATAISVGDVS